MTKHQCSPNTLSQGIHPDEIIEFQSSFQDCCGYATFSGIGDFGGCVCVDFCFCPPEPAELMYPGSDLSVEINAIRVTEDGVDILPLMDDDIVTEITVKIEDVLKGDGKC